MTQPPVTPQPTVGAPLQRVDGRLKVTGKATYTAEFELEGLAHAVMVTSRISRGRLAGLDTRAAEKAPGVLGVLTHRNAHYPGWRPWVLTQAIKFQLMEVLPLDPVVVLQNEEIRYAGQPVAVVIAETLEQAQHAAELVAASYTVEAHQIELSAALDERYRPKSLFGEPPDSKRGDVEKGLAQADVKLERVYRTAAESHNPMEPHATIAHWVDGGLTLYDASQYVNGVKQLMQQLVGLSADKIRVISRFVGGAFGSKGLAWPHVPLAAMAAKLVGRPVKLVVTRREMFGMVGFRPETIQTLRVGAKRDGSLTAIQHDGVSQTSGIGVFAEGTGMLTRILYDCPNVVVTHRIAPLDTQTPTFMRAPGEAPGSFGLECTLDELAYELGMDPLALRQKNYAHHDPESGKPWSSKALDACYREGARRFGWEKRPPKPGEWVEDGQLVGWGMATATYPANRSPASARIVLSREGQAVVQTAAHDLGTGTYTILTQVAADALGLGVEQIRVEIGDSDLPDAPVAGGSQTAASCSNAVHEAAGALVAKLGAIATQDPASPLHGLAAGELAVGGGRLYAKTRPELGEPHGQILARAGLTTLEHTHDAKLSKEAEKYSAHAWGAQFAEVRVDPELMRVRVTRFVGAFAGGRVLNARTAHSQVVGGIVMGIGMALFEEVVRDPHQGRVFNGSLGDYLVPVHADVPAIEAFFVPEEDPHVNPLGIKGLGELGIVGAGAAIANAIYHATGKRIRELPITIEKLL